MLRNLPLSDVKGKIPAQRTAVRFRCYFTFALLKTKFLGEKSGLVTKKAQNTDARVINLLQAWTPEAAREGF